MTDTISPVVRRVKAHADELPSGTIKELLLDVAVYMATVEDNVRHLQSVRDTLAELVARQQHWQALVDGAADKGSVQQMAEATPDGILTAMELNAAGLRLRDAWKSAENVLNGKEPITEG